MKSLFMEQMIDDEPRGAGMPAYETDYYQLLNIARDVSRRRRF